MLLLYLVQHVATGHMLAPALTSRNIPQASQQQEGRDGSTVQLWKFCIAWKLSLRLTKNPFPVCSGAIQKGGGVCF